MRCVLGSLVGAVALAGCYRYVPAEIGATPPGTDVQLLVTRAGTEEADLAGALRGGEPRVRGTVVAREDDVLLVRVPVAQRQDGFIVNRIDQAVRFPIGEIVSLQRRELNPLTTSLAIGGAVVGVGAAFAVLGNPLKGSTPEPPGPDELFLSFPVPLPLGR